MPIHLNPTIELDANEVSEALGEQFQNERFIISDGTKMVESDMTESSTLISTSKDFFANTVTTAQASVKIGPALTVTSGGGELLQRSQVDTSIETSIIPNKVYTTNNGTSGQLTIGKVIGPLVPQVLFSDDTLRSDDVSANNYPNNVAGKVNFFVTTTEDRYITEVRIRAATVQTGVRLVIRVGDENGPVVFETTPDRAFNEGAGFTTKVYDGNPANETVINFEESPLVAYDGITYHDTFESVNGPVVLFGGLGVDTQFKPYNDRDIATLQDDPVVAHGVILKSENYDMAGVPWHNTVLMDATSGDKTVTLPSAQGLNAQGMFIYVNKKDTSENSVFVEPFAGQTIDGETQIEIKFPNKSAVFFSDGTDVHLLDLNTNEFTDDEKAKLASLTGGRFLGVFADDTALTTAYPTGVEGDNALVNSTGTIWFWNGSAWEDSMVGSSGDMLKATYDPTAKNTSAFSMGNMDETATAKVMTNTERTKLAGIEALAEVNNISDTNATDLTDTGDTTLHYHSSDRNRSNHTGTQLANTISDFDTAVSANADVAANSVDVTLAAGDTTQETLDLTGQEVTVNLVTTTTDGAMSAEDKSKLDNISNNGAGDDWTSGLEITEHSPKNQTVDYQAGTYLINGVNKSIGTGGVYDLQNGFGAVDHYSGFTAYQHAFVIIYVDTDELIKSIGGTPITKNEIPDLPLLPADTVCLAVVEIKANDLSNPKNISNKEITDCRNTPSISTDEFVTVSADDTTTGHLSDKLSNNGNVAFTIENPGGNETLKADVDVANDTAVLANTAKVSFPEAPTDSKTYGRKDSAWVEVTGGGGGDPTSDIVSATGSITTTSATPSVMTSMTITPASGTYLVWFSGAGGMDTKAKDMSIQIYSAGSAVGHSKRTLREAQISEQFGISLNTQAKVTVNGSQAIDVRWASLDGSTIAHCYERSLMILKVA